MNDDAVVINAYSEAVRRLAATRSHCCGCDVAVIGAVETFEGEAMPILRCLACGRTCEEAPGKRKTDP